MSSSGHEAKKARRSRRLHSKSSREIRHTVTSDSTVDVLKYKAPHTLNKNIHLETVRAAEPKHAECSICFCNMTKTIVRTPCNHYFHKSCLKSALAHSTQCPICRQAVSAPQGKCPNATMSISKIPNDYNLAGADTIIQIDYSIRSGTQSSFHDNPGRRFHGTQRTAYLLDNDESRKLLCRLKYAFCHGLTFTVGRSLTTHQDNVVTWASIHHKTSLWGGSFSLPDPGYVLNCNEELDNLNVPSAEDCGYHETEDDAASTASSTGAVVHRPEY